MKLLQKTGYYFLSISIAILLIGGISIFYALEYMLDHELDESLVSTRIVLYEDLQARDTLPSVIKIMDEVIDITEVLSLNHIEFFKDTLREVFEDGEIEEEPFRMYIYQEEINGKFYQIALNHSKFDQEHLLIIISTLVIGSLLFFLLVLNIFNRYISRNIWQPFHDSLNQIKYFNLKKSTTFVQQKSDIDEFNLLNTTLADITGKLLSDYNTLKQFAENASHEIQTPLSIIRAQIELLLQEKITKNQHKRLHEIELAANRLSKLNTALLLLSRIENRQFEGTTSVELNKMVLKKLESLDIMVQSKSLEVITDMANVSVVANEMLIDILLSNLISNAIKHNLQNGKINIVLNNTSLKIENGGQPLLKSVDRLFDRFSKDNDASNSVGLGLSIVKEICLIYHWEIGYKFDSGFHVVEIKFK